MLFLPVKLKVGSIRTFSYFNLKVMIERSLKIVSMGLEVS